jgi:hypothetical protein
MTSGPEFVGIDAQDEVGYLFDLDSWTWRATDAA